MPTTTHYGLTLLDQAQAQKEVAINQALVALDALVGNHVVDKDLNAPPVSPTPGAVYIVAASPTGAWANKATQIAYFDQIWRFVVPKTGWRVWVMDENLHYRFNGTSWVAGNVGDMFKATYDPANINQQLVGVSATQTLTNKTLSGSGCAISGINTLSVGSSFSINNAGTIAAPSYSSYTSNPALNTSLTLAIGGASSVIPYNFVPKYLWHDILAFMDPNGWGVPVFETFNGVWNVGVPENTIFAQKEDVVSTIIDGVANTAARWTWNNVNVPYSGVEWFMFGFTYSVTPCTKNILIESSADGISWTPRHTSTGNAANGQVAIAYMQSNGGHAYVRLTLTVTNAQPLRISSVRALTGRWGDQGGGSEYEQPYRWDGNRNIAFGASGAVANGVVTVGTNTTTAAGGIYWGTDSNLYRVAAASLRTDSALTVAGTLTANGKLVLSATNTAAGTTGAQTINRPSGTVNFAAGASALVVTNSLCSTASLVFASIRTADATATIKNIVPAAGSFTITLGAAAAAETSVGFMVIN